MLASLLNRFLRVDATKMHVLRIQERGPPPCVRPMGGGGPCRSQIAVPVVRQTSDRTIFYRSLDREVHSTPTCYCVTCRRKHGTRPTSTTPLPPKQRAQVDRHDDGGTPSDHTAKGRITKQTGSAAPGDGHAAVTAVTRNGPEVPPRRGRRLALARKILPASAYFTVLVTPRGMPPSLPCTALPSYCGRPRAARLA